MVFRKLILKRTQIINLSCQKSKLKKYNKHNIFLININVLSGQRLRSGIILNVASLLSFLAPLSTPCEAFLHPLGVNASPHPINDVNLSPQNNKNHHRPQSKHTQKTYHNNTPKQPKNTSNQNNLVAITRKVEREMKTQHCQNRENRVDVYLIAFGWWCGRHVHPYVAGYERRRKEGAHSLEVESVVYIVGINNADVLQSAVIRHQVEKIQKNQKCAGQTHTD